MTKSVSEKRTYSDKEDKSSLTNDKGSWKTVRPDKAEGLSYGKRLTLSFIMTAVMTVLILVVILSIVWEGQFRKYTRSNMIETANSIAQTLGDEYERLGHWPVSDIGKYINLPGYSTELSIEVVASDGEIIYQREIKNKDVKTQPNALSGRLPHFSENASDAVEAPIETPNGARIGTVKLWAYGSDSLLKKADAAFRLNSYGAIWAAAGIAIFFASIIGTVVSRSLTRPISRITKTADAIREGDLSARTHLEGSDEIGKLGETFDDMANSLEDDIKMEKRITLDVAHELRTPLMAMTATIEAIQDGIYPANEEYLGIIATETNRLTRLVNAMLQLSRMESGTLLPKPERTDIVNMIHNLVVSQERLFEEKGLKLRFQNDTGKPDCFAEFDRDMIQQATINLMSNAMRYTSSGGWIVVSVSQDKNDVMIKVQDTGIGIAKEDLAKVFSRFWRSDESRERESGGLGVGLSVTKEILESHKGYISIESKLGKGTTFTLHIPKTYKGKSASIQEDM